MGRGEVVIKNACVITGDGPVYPDGFVHIRDGTIAQAGASSKAPLFPGAKVIDAKGRYVLPGFINPHVHLYGLMARGMPVGRMKCFGQILKRLWWKLDRALSIDDISVSARLGGAGALRSGVTALVDHHASYGAISGSLGAISEALAEIGLRASLCYEISDRGGLAARDEAIAESGLWLECVDARRKRQTDFLQRGMVGLHASMTLSDGTLARARELMDIYGVGAHVHVAEGKEDVAATRALAALSPVERLVKHGILRRGTLAAHCVHVDGRDLALIKGSGAHVVHNPLSNLSNAVGIAPLIEMARKKIPVVIGTDGMSAGIMGDARLASVLHRVARADAGAGAMEVKDAIWNAAPEIASGMFGMRIGRIEKGAAADVIISDAHPPTEVTKDNAWWHCLFGAMDAPVRMTIVAGSIRMQDFKVIGVDEEYLAKEARKLSAKLWKRIQETI